MPAGGTIRTRPLRLRRVSGMNTLIEVGALSGYSAAGDLGRTQRFAEFGEHRASTMPALRRTNPSLPSPARFRIAFIEV